MGYVLQQYYRARDTERGQTPRLYPNGFRLGSPAPTPDAEDWIAIEDDS